MLGCGAMRSTDPDAVAESPRRAERSEREVEYVIVSDLRSRDDTDTCLRPLGLCELGGACDSCWYRPDHPRFEK
jgi:hypothetical protein